MTAKTIVIVDDEENVGASLRLVLEGAGYVVAVCRSAADFRRRLARSHAEAYLLDVRLPDANGIELLPLVAEQRPHAPVIMISGHATIADAVAATRAGAFDFLEKPLGRDRLLLVLKNALEQAALQRENARLRELVGDAPRMIGSSAAFQRVLEQATQVARSDARVLLTGESGTGKELLAAHMHRNSPFATGPFVKVNCAAIPVDLLESELFGHEKGAFTGATSSRRGKFELADGGTIFLDEVRDLHEASQAKLLRVLQEGEFQRVGGERTMQVTVRVVSATNQDLAALVAEKKFREDLYYRLSVVPIRVPPLRERPEDIRPLAEYFVDEFCRRNNFKPKRIDGGVFEEFRAYRWPGNIRELRNVVERMAILAPDPITADAVPVEIRLSHQPGAPSTLEETRAQAERDLVREALAHAGWNISAAARALGIERTRLHKRIRALGLEREGRGR
ncbi:MAG TPA: sigma-54 dependent transcriptional regulator [Vicinamibacterales bacterium]|jgi:two-component system nitrogen regulation response regulator NtrX